MQTIRQRREELDQWYKAIHLTLEEAEATFDAATEVIFNHRLELWERCDHSAYTDEMFLAEPRIRPCPDCGKLDPYTDLPHRFQKSPLLSFDKVVRG